MDKAKKVDRKKDIHFKIASAVKKVQKQYISSIKTGSDNAGSPVNTEELCGFIEAIFLHELKNSKGVLWREIKRPNPIIPPQPSFWVFIEPMVSDEIKMQLLALRNSDLEVRKCRSWVRLMLAKNRMINFLEDILRHPGLLASHYGGRALLRDSEQSEIIIHLLRGLVVLHLDYDYASSKLDMWDPSVLQVAGLWEDPGSEVVSQSGPSSEPSAGSSPGHPSSSVQRVSPPASDFDLEGVSIIGIALDKYSKKRSASSTMSDSQLISKEIAQQLNHTPNHTPNQERQGSIDSSSLGLEGDLPSGSYGAMLRSYAKRAGDQITTGSETTGTARTVGGSGTRAEQEEEWEDEEEEEEEDINTDRFTVALSLNYEIISSDGSLVDSVRYEPHQKQRLIMIEHLVKLVNEKGLDSQNYKCFGCRRNIGLIFGPAKLCKFNGQNYCYDCHRDDERVIPARVLFNWDFRPHKVCLASCEFLDSVEKSPILDIEQINKALYIYIPALEETLKLRRQCRYLKDYLITCNKPTAIEQFRRRLRSSHIYEDIHKYSIRDLLDVNNGTFSERLRKLVKVGIKHIKNCELCSQKGFICEVCNHPQVIYPFDMDGTSQCASCKSVYHLDCRPENSSCPKCIRLRRRANTISD